MIEVEDDGAGLDIDKIRAKAVERGPCPFRCGQKPCPKPKPSSSSFFPGFSTADQVGDQAGRGVGMDVVKRVIESMNGHIDVESIRGVGTKFTLHLPLTLLIATALDGPIRRGALRDSAAERTRGDDAHGRFPPTDGRTVDAAYRRRSDRRAAAAAAHVSERLRPGWKSENRSSSCEPARGPSAWPSTNCSAVRKSSLSRSGRLSRWSVPASAAPPSIRKGAWCSCSILHGLISGGEQAGSQLESSTEATAGTDTDTPFQDTEPQPIDRAEDPLDRRLLKHPKVRGAHAGIGGL